MKLAELKANECMIIKEHVMVALIARGFSRSFNSFKEAEKEANTYNLTIVK